MLRPCLQCQLGFFFGPIASLPPAIVRKINSGNVPSSPRCPIQTFGEMGTGRWGQTGSSPFSRTTNQYLPNEIVQINIRKRPVCPLGSSPWLLAITSPVVSQAYLCAWFCPLRRGAKGTRSSCVPRQVCGSVVCGVVQKSVVVDGVSVIRI